MDYLIRITQKEFEADYRIITKKSKMLKKRKYRGVDPKQEKPAEHDLSPKADYKLYKETKEKERKEPKMEEKPKPQEEIQILKPETTPKVKPQILELPKYEIQKSEKGDLIKVLVELPNISQMAEIDLFVSENCVKVSAKGYSEVNISFEQPVDKTNVHARFNKKKKVLSISLIPITQH